VLVDEAIGSTTEEATLYRSGYRGLLSSLILSQTTDHSSSPDTVKIRPLSYWLDFYPQFRKVDLLSIDVEGAELSVLQGIDFAAFEARIIIIEIDNPDTNAVQQALNILYAHQYRPFARNHHNLFLASQATRISDSALAQIKFLSSSIQLVENHADPCPL
jgi:hypothetical protein